MIFREMETPPASPAVANAQELDGIELNGASRVGASPFRFGSAGRLHCHIPRPGNATLTGGGGDHVSATLGGCTGTVSLSGGAGNDVLYFASDFFTTVGSFSMIMSGPAQMPSTARPQAVPTPSLPTPCIGDTFIVAAAPTGSTRVAATTSPFEPVARAASPLAAATTSPPSRPGPRRFPPAAATTWSTAAAGQTIDGGSGATDRGRGGDDLTCPAASTSSPVATASIRRASPT